jgi:sugar (pentulose or hexulose) kinase
MNERSVLAIDCGTQSLRAIVFSPGGSIAASAKVEYEHPYFSNGPGLAEQDPELYWDSFGLACARLKNSYPDVFRSIAGIGVTAQRASMVNLDKHGNVLRPAILWLDQRKAKPFPVWNFFAELCLRITGIRKKIDGIQARGQCTWIMQNQPEIWEKTHKYLQVSGFLNYRLTGRFADSTASQIGYLPFDYKKQEWAQPFHLSSRLFPVERDKLAKLVKPGRILGRLTEKAAQFCGLEKGLPVIACGSDKGCETLGAGVINEEMASLSFGTTATVQTMCAKYIEPVRHFPSYPAPVPGYYNPEIEIFRGFWMITWFKKQFAHREVQRAAELGIAAEELLNKCLERTEPGAMGLVVQPYWTPGLDHPEGKGAMIGFADVHTKDHIYRAVIEGLGFAMFEGLGKIEKKTGKKIKAAAVSGGASQSDEICRIMASVFNLPMYRGRTHETSALGAAILTAAGLGWYQGVNEAVENMVHVKAVFRPDPDHVQVYRQLYSKVYARLYRALSPLYSQIQTITGYPQI